MPSPAVQTPFHPTAAERKSRRVYMKQVLPLGSVEHPEHGTLDFTGDLMGELVETFEGGALTQVPFVLCNDDNRHPGGGAHNGDPERFRGEVTALERRDDGLYAKVETTERGAALLADNPTQPVSVRIITPTSGKYAGKAVLGHVAATLDEVAKHMHPWQQIEASSDLEITDLSDGVLVIPDAGHGRPAPNMAETETPTLTDEDQGLLKRFADRLKARGTSEEARETPELTDEQVDEVLAGVLDEAETANAEHAGEQESTETEEGEAETVAALSSEDRQAIDLARREAREARADANAERFKRERAEMVRAGIPPAAVDLSRPVLEHGLPDQIDLSNGEKVDAAKIVRGLLDQMKGTIDFSEVGSTDGEGSEAEEARRLAKVWADGGGEG